jgi:hypothetical protein
MGETLDDLHVAASAGRGALELFAAEDWTSGHTRAHQQGSG